MKAAQINEYGHVDAIVLTEVETPQPGQEKVLVEVHASSINPVDTIVREGMMKVPELPVTLGGDLAGIVVKTSIEDSFSVGDKVYGQASALAGNSGAFAEFAATSPTQLAKMPAGVSFEQAASLPLVGVSALQALTDHLNLQSGQKLFIHGGAGGIGSIAIQIAKHMGAYVATTATAEGIDFVKKLGADEVIDYKTQQFDAMLHDYDAVFDTVGGDDFPKSLGVLRAGGTAVSMVAAADEQAKSLGVTAIRQLTQVTDVKLAKLTELVETGIVTPQVDTVFPLDQIRQAFEARESGRIHGKVVISIKQ